MPSRYGRLVALEYPLGVLQGQLRSVHALNRGVVGRPVHGLYVNGPPGWWV
jgi:hypothetical protein